MTDIWEKLKELFDAIRIEHSGSIYDTGDYQTVVEATISKLKTHYKPIEEKADALDKMLKTLTSSEGSDVIFPLDKFMVMKEKAEKLEDVREWWLLFNQCIDSEAVKTKLEEILEQGKVESEKERQIGWKPKRSVMRPL